MNKQPSRFRDGMIYVRLSKEEMVSIKGDAERTGLAVGSYVRLVLLGVPAPRQVRRPPVERKELAHLIGQLGHMGGNLNQIARKVNYGLGLGEAELQSLLADLRTVKDMAVRALGREP